MERLEIIEALKHFPANLREELANVSESALRYKPAESEWSIRETLGHLVFLDHVWYRRLYMVWALSDPVLPVFDSEGEQAAIARGRDASVPAMLDEIAGSRLRTVDLLAQAVDWTRIGTWRGVGRRSLKQLAEHLMAHDADHMMQIARLRAAQAAAPTR